MVERIETQNQFRFLRQHGCDVAQGYYFSRPVTAEKLVELLSGGIQ
ncbi:EAL domain-containing protein [Thiohalophilus sp.]|nr:EAL domain-containing protein [Thiohalophilus sp.]